MKVLVACECSGRVRDAFIARGHDAWSCDLQMCYPSPNYKKHIRGDVTEILKQPWDLVIAHPPCTYLCHTGVRWLRDLPTQEQRDRRLRLLQCAAQFFLQCLNANASMVCVENPRLNEPAKGIIQRTHTQIIEPYQFGDPWTKRTYLWLVNLPQLRHTKVIKPTNRWVTSNNPKARRDKAEGKKEGAGGSQKNRSITFQGIADAMADQWGSLVLKGGERSTTLWP